MTTPSTTTTTTTTTADIPEMIAELQARYDRTVELGEILVQEVQDMADRLYDFQYASDERCHRVENLELRPLYQKLGDLYHDWQRARVAPITGDYAVDPMRVLERYKNTMLRFTRAMRVIGLADDYEEVYSDLVKLNATLMANLLLLEVLVPRS